MLSRCSQNVSYNLQRGVVLPQCKMIFGRYLLLFIILFFSFFVLWSGSVCVYVDLHSVWLLRKQRKIWGVLFLCCFGLGSLQLRFVFMSLFFSCQCDGFVEMEMQNAGCRCLRKGVALEKFENGMQFLNVEMKCSSCSHLIQDLVFAASLLQFLV